MARLSLWQDGRHSNNYKFFDKKISEMFTVGGTGVLLNKYLGPVAQGTQLTTSATQTAVNGQLVFNNTTGVKIGDFANGVGIPPNTTVTAMTPTTVTLSANVAAPIGTNVNIGFSADATQPSYANQSEKNIQDLLWIENRDRKYDPNVYKLRGHYNKGDQDFDLSQFGLFLQTGTIFMTFHTNDMLDAVGRHLMAGDVLEFEHLKDYHPLDTDLPTALKRFYVVGDTARAAEGFSPTWWSHTWRCKLTPLVDSQEYKDILNNLKASSTSNTPVGQVITTYQKYFDINQSIIAQAEVDVPLSGYNTADFYTLPTTEDRLTPLGNPITSDTTRIDADNTIDTADEGPASPTGKIQGYLTGDGKGPNGLPVGAGIAFPANAKQGDYFLRLDYLPNRLFRFNGNQWIKIEDNVRTNLTPGAANNLTDRMGYVNNNSTYKDSQGNTHNTVQPLSKVLTPKADNNG